MDNKSLIEKVFKEFNEIERTIKLRPTLGSEKWILVEVYISDDNILELSLEDGHVYHHVKLRYIDYKSKFEIIENQ